MNQPQPPPAAAVPAAATTTTTTTASAAAPVQATRPLRVRTRSVSPAFHARESRGIKGIAPRLRLVFELESGDCLRLSLSLTSALWLREQIAQRAFDYWRKKEYPNLPDIISDQTTAVLRARWEQQISGDETQQQFRDRD